LKFRFAEGQNIETLVAKLAAHNWRGEIVGPHGSGKTSLLAALLPALAAAGCQVHEMRVRDEAPPARRTINTTNCERRLFVVDGFKQLGWLSRLRLKRHCRKSGAGLLVTSHAPAGLPILAKLAPNRALVELLVADLCSTVTSRITREDVAASHDCHGSNVREIFFDLYDRHERIQRLARTAAVHSA
jgi:hypothetical protein